MSENQRGFTLVELLVSIAISGLIFGLIATLFFQMSTISGSGNDQLTVWHELQNVTDRLTVDCQTALTATVSNGLILTYPSGGPVSYSLAGTNLQRTSGSTVNTLAQDITSLNFSVNGRLVTMNITCTVPGRTGESEQLSSLVNLRPSAP
jgi:prepilin-type N-terminal cleavage/methylation domain-containing protein